MTQAASGSTPALSTCLLAWYFESGTDEWINADTSQTPFRLCRLPAISTPHYCKILRTWLQQNLRLIACTLLTKWLHVQVVVCPTPRRPRSLVQHLTTWESFFSFYNIRKQKKWFGEFLGIRRAVICLLPDILFASARDRSISAMWSAALAGSPCGVLTLTLGRKAKGTNSIDNGRLLIPWHLPKSPTLSSTFPWDPCHIIVSHQIAAPGDFGWPQAAFPAWLQGSISMMGWFWPPVASRQSMQFRRSKHF